MKLIRLYLIIIAILCLNSCIAPPGMSPTALPPLTSTISGNPDLNTQEYILKQKKFIYSGDQTWIKIASFSDSTPINYKISIVPTGPNNGYDNAHNSAKGVSKNNVLNMCYSFSSTKLGQDIPSLLGTGTSSHYNCPNILTNPYSKTNDCYKNMSFLDNSGNVGASATSDTYPGAKLYVVLEGGSANDPAFQGAVIQNHCVGNKGRVMSGTSGCSGSDKRCNTSCSIVTEPSSCTAQVVGPWLYSKASDKSCSDYCNCDSAYEGSGQISQKFAKGECLFANGMGYTFGYGNKIANLHSGANMFSNSLDPETIIFQNSEVMNLPACKGSNCQLNFSLAGSATSSYTSADMNPESWNGYNILMPPKNTKFYQWQKSKFPLNGVNSSLNEQDAVFYSLGVQSSPNSCSSQVTTPVYLTYMFAEKTGCYAIGGKPLNAADQQAGNGKLEYYFSSPGVTPDDKQKGKGTIDGKSQGEYFYSIQGVSRNAQDIYVRIKDAGSRSDNYGYYEVNFYQKNTSKYGFLGKVVSYVADPVQTQIFTVSEQFFSNVANSSTFLTIINSMLTLYIALFGVSFLMGNTKITQRDLVTRIFKIGVVLVFMNNKTSTAFFNQYLLDLFWNGMTDLISYVTGTNYIVSSTGQHQLDYEALFAFSNSVIGALFSPNFLTILFMLLLWIPVGWIIFILMVKGVLIYLKALIVAIVSYLIALTAVGLFIGMAPIFIVLVLFDQTRQIFNNWLQVMTSFVFQPVIMFASIAVVNQLMKTIIYDFTSLSVSLTKVLSITLPLGGSLKIPLLDLYWWMPIYSLMTLVILVITFNIFCEILKQTPAFASTLSRGLFKTGAGSSAGQVGGLASDMVGNNPAFQALGMDDKTQSRIENEQKKSDRTKGASEDGQKQGRKDVSNQKNSGNNSSGQKDSPQPKT